MLLVNIAIAADILELFELLKEEEVGHNFTLVMVVLILWSCSLVQVFQDEPQLFRIVLLLLSSLRFYLYNF